MFTETTGLNVATLSGTPDTLKGRNILQPIVAVRYPRGLCPQQIIIEYAPWLTMEQVEKS